LSHAEKNHFLKQITFLQELNFAFEYHRNFRNIVNQKLDEKLLKRTLQWFAPTSKGVLFIDESVGHIYLHCTSFKGSQVAQFIGTVRQYKYQSEFHLSAMELK